MDNKNKLRFKAMVLLSTYFYMFSFFSSKFNEVFFHTKDVDVTSFEPYKEYSGGNVYILDDSINHVPYVDNGDVYVIDVRNSKNPDMQICNSFAINNKDEMIEILKILLEYEEKYPSGWNRSLQSMVNEWYIHNFCYHNYIFQSRTCCVDMDNDDEEKYSFEFIRKFVLKK